MLGMVGRCVLGTKAVVMTGKMSPVRAMKHPGGSQPVGHDDEVGHGDVMVITDSAGVFQHRVMWCMCGGEPGPDQPMQLFKEQLFPATYHQPKSAFTFNVLDYFYIDV